MRTVTGRKTIPIPDRQPKRGRAKNATTEIEGEEERNFGGIRAF